MLDVRGLRTVFKNGKQSIRAVDGVSFTVGDNEVVGLVGESGSGKSVTSLSCMNLLPANAAVSGEVLWNGKNVLTMTSREHRQFLGRDIGMIFQNPLASLNPVFTVGAQLIETIMLHQCVNKKEARTIAAGLLTQVKIPDADTRLDDYPHQFSLGMCQRIMIALTLAMKPRLIIADEPTASLDVTIQAQVLGLLDALRKEKQMSILMISHDLGVIAQCCDRILIMYLGKIVEVGTPNDIFKSPRHPYTQALIDAIPVPDPDVCHTPKAIDGDIPSPANLPKGCRFNPRCPLVTERCRNEEPELVDNVACWNVTR